MSSRELVIQALEQYRGDNLHRARMAFRHCSPAELQMEYGQSGRTRAEILDEYEKHDAAVNAALAWVLGCADA